MVLKNLNFSLRMCLKISVFWGARQYNLNHGLLDSVIRVIVDAYSNYSKIYDRLIHITPTFIWRAETNFCSLL
jgi:hypothetical protein